MILESIFKVLNISVKKVDSHTEKAFAENGSIVNFGNNNQIAARDMIINSVLKNAIVYTKNHEQLLNCFSQRNAQRITTDIEKSTNQELLKQHIDNEKKFIISKFESLAIDISAPQAKKFIEIMNKAIIAIDNFINSKNKDFFLETWDLCYEQLKELLSIENI